MDIDGISTDHIDRDGAGGSMVRWTALRQEILTP